MAIVIDTKPIDLRCDAVFGEQVILKPMKSVGTGYRESAVDNSRPVTLAVGIYDQTRGAVQETGGGFNHRQSTVATTLSIRYEPLEQCGLRKGDYVTFPERDETYEVSHIHAEPGGRPDVHLLRVLDDDE
jgi:hypothetical protein